MLRIVLALVASLLFTGPLTAGETPPQFEFHQTEVYTGKLRKPILSKKMCAELPDDTGCFWDFRTRIRDGAASEGINYGGRYTLVWWGSGSPCQMGVIVDRTNGNMIWLPIASLGYDMRADSELLIVNPHPEEYVEEGEELPDWLRREFYLLKDGQFALEYDDRGDGVSSDTANILDTQHPVNPAFLEEMEKTGEFKEIIEKICRENPQSTLCQ